MIPQGGKNIVSGGCLLEPNRLDGGARLIDDCCRNAQLGACHRKFDGADSASQSRFFSHRCLSGGKTQAAILPVTRVVGSQICRLNNSHHGQSSGTRWPDAFQILERIVAFGEGIWQNVALMAFRCTICGKGPVAGKSISHSHRATNRRFLPNVRQVRVLMNGSPRRVKVCSRCIRSGKVIKAGPRQFAAV